MTGDRFRCSPHAWVPKEAAPPLFCCFLLLWPPGECPFSSNTLPPHAPCRLRVQASAKAYEVCGSRCAPCPIVSTPRSVAPRSHMLGRVFVAWPGGIASAVRMLTLSVLSLSNGSHRSLDHALPPEKRRFAVFFLAPQLVGPAELLIGGTNVSGQLSRISSLLLLERPIRPQWAGRLGQCGHSKVRHHHSCTRLASPASFPCLNPALLAAALITLLPAQRPPCLLP